MRKLNGKQNGDLIVSDAVEFHGMIDGNVTLGDGAHWDHHGMVNGDLIVGVGARAEVHGMINGTLINLGGEAKVYGTVEAIRDENGAKTVVDAKAHVRTQ